MSDVKQGLSRLRFVKVVNGCVARLTVSPRWGRLVGRGIAMLTYTGRKSGRTFTIPIGYRRTADGILITVAMPDSKTWWRNFLRDGGPLSVRLDGVDRQGHAVARRDERGRVTVDVRLAPADAGE
ncbi:nitroreductase/quinone reductase family protein [Actinoplanes sp. NPDC026619]|uniref:nitroreductase/quinone reductase family protein n=1 Tax=Actinoplanes sp. NPDC026619 TaxID=3155798 RepID=UPI0033F814EC